MTAIEPLNRKSERFLDRLHVCHPVAEKARRLYPGVVGEVLADEVLSLAHLGFLGESSRAAQLFRVIQAVDEPVMDR